MSRLIIPLLLSMVALATGCPKSAARTAAVDPDEPRITASERRTAEEAVEGVPADLRASIREELALQAPSFNISIDEATQTIQGLAMSPEGLLIDVAVSQIHNIAGPRGDLTQQAFRAEAVQQFYELLQQREEEVAAADASITPEQRAQIDEQERVAEEYLRPAEMVIGDWRSRREQREGEQELLLEHSDAYYKLLLLPYESTKLIQTEWKDGSETSKAEFQYTYDADTGELTTLLPDGSPGPVYIIKYRLSEPNMLYVKPQGEFIYTVYEKIGAGGRPQTQAEMDAAIDQVEARPRPDR